MADLPPAALQAIEDAVRAVAAADERRLAAMGADASELYTWTREYGAYGAVHLVVPPGSPSEWPIDAVDVVDGTKHVEVGMWTREEGRSDLTLEIELRETGSGAWEARILDLHVL
jgi:hypothetical protein